MHVSLTCSIKICEIISVQVELWYDLDCDKKSRDRWRVGGGGDDDLSDLKLEFDPLASKKMGMKWAH